MGHAKLSPSSSNRWLNCPGSIAAIDALPVGDDSNVYADEGTFAHLMAESALNTPAEIWTIDEALTDLLDAESKCGRFTAGPDMIEHITEYVEFCDDARTKGQASWVEAQVKAIHGKVYGTADFIAVVDNVLEVIDFKYGAGIPVSPVDNTQAMTYAVGALNRIESTDTRMYDGIDTVSIRIFQPRNSKGGGQSVISKGRLETWRDDVLIPGAKATEDPDAPRKAGDHCRFCPVKSVCYALKEASLEGAKAVFADPAELTLAETQPTPSDLTADQVSKVLEAAPLIEAWLKGVRAYAFERLMAGGEIEGYKLVGKKGIRAWSDKKAAETMLREMLPEGVSVHAEPKLLSPAQSAKKLDIIGKALVNQLTTKPDTGKTLVPNSDKRQAFRPGDVFNIIE